MNRPNCTVIFKTMVDEIHICSITALVCIPRINETIEIPEPSRQEYLFCGRVTNVDYRIGKNFQDIFITCKEL